MQTSEVKKGASDYHEEKRRKAAKRKALNRVNKIEEEISKLEAEAGALGKQLLDPEIAADYVAAGDIARQLDENKEKTEELMQEWESLSNEIEEDNF